MHPFQRPHTPTPTAIPKPYHFLELDLAHPNLLPELTKSPLPWQPSQWKWHRGTYFCVLRGGPTTPIPASELVTGTNIDAPHLAALPQLRALLDHGFPDPAPLAWLGLSPRGGVIRAHIDNTEHWDHHHRIHVPLVTNPHAVLYVDGGCLHLAAGRAWALNNSLVHGAYNGGPSRLHLIVDLPSTPAVEAWLATGEARRGTPNPVAERHIGEDPLANLSPRERANLPLLKVMAQQ